MRIRRRGLTRVQVGVATVLGVLGGAYIWKPLFEKHLGHQSEKPQTSALLQVQKEKEITSIVPISKLQTVNSNNTAVGETGPGIGVDETELLTLEFEAARTTE